MDVSFDICGNAPNSGARVGRLHTPHGDVDTPAFMPVGTRGTVRGITPSHLERSGAQMLLANAYHLALRPGHTVVAELGELHTLMGWSGPILTDSGGYQVLSLAEHREVSEQGVRFTSPEAGGAVIFIGPEESIAIQETLGSDIAMAFDELVPADSSREVLVAAMQRTTRWAARCCDARTRPAQALFGIVQGGNDPELRAAHAAELAALPFDGFGIGGLGVGETRAERVAAVAACLPALPPALPRYLMGIGKPPDLIDAVAEGIELFDCVVPTRAGRNTEVYTRTGKVHLRNAPYTSDARPIDAACNCEACRRYSRGALRHFFRSNEMLGPILAALHNLTFYQDLLRMARAAIPEGRLHEVAAIAERSTQPEPVDPGSPG